MAFDLNQAQLVARWFEFPEDKGERYRLRFTTGAEVENHDDEGLFDLILLDWEGVTSNGVAVPCTKENRNLFLGSPAGKVRLAWMVTQSFNVRNFFDAEAMRKN